MTKTKNSKPETSSSSSEETNWGLLNVFYASAREVGETAIDDFTTIKRSSIDKNEETLKKDSEFNTFLVRNVAKNFVESINKSLDNLAELKIDIIKEVRKRYPNLEDDWLTACPEVVASTKTPTIKIDLLESPNCEIEYYVQSNQNDTTTEDLTSDNHNPTVISDVELGNPVLPLPDLELTDEVLNVSDVTSQDDKSSELVKPVLPLPDLELTDEVLNVADVTSQDDNESSELVKPVLPVPALDLTEEEEVINNSYLTSRDEDFIRRPNTRANQREKSAKKCCEKVDPTYWTTHDHKDDEKLLKNAQVLLERLNTSKSSPKRQKLRNLRSKGKVNYAIASGDNADASTDDECFPAVELPKKLINGDERISASSAKSEERGDVDDDSGVVEEATRGHGVIVSGDINKTEQEESLNEICDESSDKASHKKPEKGKEASLKLKVTRTRTQNKLRDDDTSDGFAITTRRVLRKRKASTNESGQKVGTVSKIENSESDSSFRAMRNKPRVKPNNISSDSESECLFDKKKKKMQASSKKLQ